MIQRSNFALLATIITSFMLFTSLASSAFAGQQDIEQMRKQFRKLERDQAKSKGKIAQLQAKLEKKKSALRKKHEAAFSFEVQKSTAAKIAAWFNKNPNADSVDIAFDATEPFLKEAFGAEIVKCSKTQCLDLYAAIITEKQKSKAPTEQSRVARGLRDAFDQTLGIDFAIAFDKVLRKQTREWARLEKEQKNLDTLTIKIETLRRQQTASLSAVIPTGMVPVPEAKGVQIGISYEGIGRLSHDLNDPAKRNFLLLWSTPPRTVSVDAFMIEAFEVTHLAYWYFCQQTGHPMPKWFAGYEDLPGVDDDGKKKRKAIWNDVWPDGKVPESMKRLPVTWVSYNDAMAYCLWTQSRLPTEFEWEVASRSGPNGYDGRIWPWGNDYRQQACNDATAIDHDARKAAGEALPEGNYVPGVVPGGTFPDSRNPLGIYDMAGSVAELTASPFLAYPGYQGKMKTEEGVVSAPNDFNEQKIVVRGGHCDNRDVIVSSVFRAPIAHANRRKEFVGFRRARSGHAGTDQLRYLMRNNRLDSRLLDFKLTRGDKKAKRIFPKLDTRKNYFAIAEKFDFNEELQVPGKGHKILIVNRDTNELLSEKWAKKFSKGEKDINDSFLAGILETDIDIMDPPLKAGTWFVSFKKGRKFRDPETKKKKVLKDAIMFVPFKSGEPAIRVDYSGTEITTQSKKNAAAFQTQVTPILISGDTSTYDKLELTWVFDIGRTGKKAVVELSLKVAKGKLKGFK